MSQLKKPRLVVVLGMHRSGTSVTTNLLSAFGLPLSDDLMQATEFNAKGYFESQAIAKIHDDVLAVFGMRWDTTSFMVPFPRDWWLMPAVAPMKERLRTFITAELEKHEGLWGFKDPRTARLLPLWNEIIRDLDIDARFVLATRHPSEVAGSLSRRDKINPVQAEAMWLEHNVDAVLHTRGQLHAIVDYTTWMREPVQQARYMLEKTGLGFPGSSDEFEQIVAGIVSPDLRHHEATQSSFSLPFSKPFYDTLLARDVRRLVSLADVFNIARSFTQVYLPQATAALRQERDQALALARSQMRTLGTMEQYVRGMNQAMFGAERIGV